MSLPLPERSELRCYTSEQIDRVWSTYKPHIQKALDRGSNYTIDDIYLGLRSKAMQLWTYGSDAAMVTTIQNKDDERWCLLLALGGSRMDEWKEYMPVLEDWARSNGCIDLRIYGRYGWRKLGFEPVYTKLVRKLK